MKTSSLITFAVLALCAFSTPLVHAQQGTVTAANTDGSDGSSAANSPDFLPGVGAPSGSGDDGKDDGPFLPGVGTPSGLGDGSDAAGSMAAGNPTVKTPKPTTSSANKTPYTVATIAVAVTASAVASVM